MGIGLRRDIEILGSDGKHYKFEGNLFRCIETGRMATREMQYELEGEIIGKGQTFGEGIFRDLLIMARHAGHRGFIERTENARKWMRKAADGVIEESRIRESREGIRSELLRESEFKNVTGGIPVGRPCMFIYDPVHKKELEYYDRFPVIIPISSTWRTKGGKRVFLGLNMHYLQFEYRAILLDMIYKVFWSGSKESTYKLDVTYEKLMKNISKYRLFYPTLHMYREDRIRSRIIQIAPNGWTMCFFLPVQNFAKATSAEVWKDSIEKANKIAKRGK